MKSPVTLSLIFVFLFVACCARAAVEDLSIVGLVTGTDISPKNGFIDWFDNHPGRFGEDGYDAYFTAAEFALPIPPGAMVKQATLQFSILNPGTARQVELNIIPGYGGIGFGTLVIKDFTQRFTIFSGTTNLILDATAYVSSLVSTGAAFIDFNLREIPGAVNQYVTMTLLNSASNSPRLLVDYESVPAPGGHLQYQIGTSNGPALWNFTGELPNGLTHLPNGTLFGYKSSGGVKGDAKGVNIHLAFKIPYNVGEYDYYKYAFTLDPVAKTLNGFETHKSITVTCETIIGPCQRHTTTEIRPFIHMLQPGNDGGWTLELALKSTSSTLSGNAFITFPNGEMYSFPARGKISSKKQQATLLLSGSRYGPSFLISTTLPDMSIQSIRGKFGGQKLDWHL